MINAVISGTGAIVPQKVMKNDQLPKKLMTSHEWIVQRTGIEQRYIANENETTVSMGEQAARMAMKNAGVKVEEIDMIILATSTPNHTFPASAVEIQQKLGMKHGCAFDMQAVCSGFIFALATADTYIKSGKAKKIVVIGSETFSRILDWEDRTTCVLFGDGAGAVVVEAQETKGENKKGILTTQLRSDGEHVEKLYVDGGPSTSEKVGKLKMQGKEVFKHAVAMITDVVENAFKEIGISANDIDWFIPHQANKRIIEASAKKLDIKQSKIVMTVSQHGNTSAASIPLALHNAVAENKIKENDLILLEAMGGGFTWGAIVIRW